MNNDSLRRMNGDIDYKESLLDLLSQWKALLIIALLMALLLCGVRHMKDVRANNSAIEAQKEEASRAEMSIEEQVEEVLAPFAQSDRETIKYVINEQDWINKQKQYIRESILMQTDPTNQRILSIVYDIDAENSADLPVLLHAYYAHMYSDEFVAAVKPIIAPDAEDKYINELFYKDNDESAYSDIEGRSAAFKVNIILPEETDKDALVATVTDVFTKNSGKIKTNYPHVISLASAEEAHIYHSTNASIRMNMFKNVNELETNLKNAQSTLSEPQKSAISKITQILTEQKEAAEEAADAADEAVLTEPGWNKKHAVLGFVFGGIMYVFLFLLRTLFRKRLDHASDTGRCNGLRLLGEFYRKAEDGGLAFLLHSKLVDQFRYKDRLDEETQLARAISSIEATCEHSGVKNVSLFAFDGEKLGYDMADKLASLLKSKDIEAETVKLTGEIDEKTLLSKENSVFVMGKGTEASSVLNAASLCADYDVKTLGNIFVGKAYV